MKYFKMNTINDESIIGCKWPQAQMYIPSDVKKYMFNGIDIRKDLKSISEQLKISLLPGANLTDVISSTELTNALLISKKLKKILKRASTGTSYFMPVKIQHGNNVLKNYELFVLRNSIDELISCEKSKFYIAHKVNDTPNKKYINIKSVEDIQQINTSIQKEQFKVFWEKIYIEQNKMSDMFSFQYCPQIFVSEKIISILQKKKISGITFNCAEMPEIETFV